MVANNYGPLDKCFDGKDVSAFATSYLMHHVEAVSSLDVSNVAELIGLLRHTRDRDYTIYFAGNGGKAALCSEFVNDLTVALPFSRFKAHSLMENVPGLTGAANDYGWDEALSRRLEPLANTHDVVVMLSGSGTSKNILHLLDTANDMRLQTVGIGRGGRLHNSVDLSILIDAHEDGPTEDAILALIHIVYAWFMRLDRPGSTGERLGSAGG